MQSRHSVVSRNCHNVRATGMSHYLDVKSNAGLMPVSPVTMRPCGERIICEAVADGGACGVQVIDTSHELEVKNNDDLVLTSRVTTRLRHPCIVRTMAHCVTEAPSSKPWDSAHSAPSRSSSKRDACWMMLEYCDKGTLQVRPPHTLRSTMLPRLHCCAPHPFIPAGWVMQGRLPNDAGQLLQGHPACAPMSRQCRAGLTMNSAACTV